MTVNVNPFSTDYLRAGRIQFDPFVTPAPLPAGLTDDWNPGIEDVSVLNVQTNNAGSQLGGIVAPTTSKSGRWLLLLNHGDGNGSRGTSPLTIIHRSLTSAGINRFVCPDLTNVELPYTGGALLKYEFTGGGTGSWFLIATSDGGRLGLATVGDLWFSALYPGVLTGVNNDFEPAGWTTSSLVQMLVNAGGATITGLKYFGGSVANDPFANAVYQAGIVRWIVNRSGTESILITNEDPASQVQNRILSPIGDFKIPPDSSCLFIYDFLQGRWRAHTNVGGFSKISTVNQSLDTLGNGANNDWDPTDWNNTTHRKVVPGAGSTITGMLAQETGAIRTLVAFGTFTILHQNAGSAAHNQIFLPTAYQAGGLTLNVGDSVTFRYDATFTNWMTIGLAH